MKRTNIPIPEFNTDIFTVLDKDWMLLTAGTMEHFNCMTISWGAMGTMWNKPLIIVGVRPQRYTYEFMEKSADFTLTAFPADFKDKLLLCGTKSGRDIDKIAECGLTPISSAEVSSPAYEEAQLIIECRKLFHNDIIEAGFEDLSIIDAQYPAKDFHRMYYAEALKIQGNEKFRNS